MIWATLTLFTHMFIYESTIYKSYESWVIPAVMLQAGYTAYTGYHELGAVRAVLAFAVNIIVLDACHYYYLMSAKNKYISKRDSTRR
jgi:hypothetical protein